MKSLPMSIGSIKMKGKLTKTLACGCCVMQNLKWQERLKEAKREIFNTSKEIV